MSFLDVLFTLVVTALYVVVLALTVGVFYRRRHWAARAGAAVLLVSLWLLPAVWAGAV